MGRWQRTVPVANAEFIAAQGIRWRYKANRYPLAGPPRQQNGRPLLCFIQPTMGRLLDHRKITARIFYYTLFLTNFIRHLNLGREIVIKE